ncbi:ThuA domain-containing protein [Streptomyces sp. NPDC002659]|uniref:ThuA domain-containing protein n=1 Tax=Streptomyces sp. NPDC002659 TaxID=3364656 RepID=UPI0036B3CD3E
MRARTFLSASTVLLTALAGVSALSPSPAAAADGFDVLVFSKTAEFRHDSIGAGIQAIEDIGSANGFTVTATEDASTFTESGLAPYEAVVFLSTTGDVLNDAQQSAFESYIQGGGGFAGVHAAADTEYGWPFYGDLVGARFKNHPAIQQANVNIEDRAHSSTAHLASAPWTRTDEWYDYRSNPRPGAHVLASLDESSYSPANPMGDHPITWCKDISGGRSWYTGFGHTTESYADPAFRTMLLGGIRYAAGSTNADCRPETGYTPLYNGSTSGWSQAGPGSFSNSDATLKSQGGLGLFWYSAQQYTSYSLKLDWMMDGDDNSGVFLGFPPSDDPMSAVSNGYEVQIDATDAPDRTTGAVYSFQGPDTAARDAAVNPPGTWNTYELRVEGEHLQVFLNGTKINDYTNTDPARSLAGHIGIQNHGNGDDVSFRNIRVKDLSAAAPATVQAEAYSSADGVSPFTKAGAHGGQTLGHIEAGDWARYDGLAVNGKTGFSARVVSGGPGGTLQVRTGSPTGPILGSVAVPNTGDWSTFQDVSTNLSDVPAGTADVYLTFAGSGGGLFDVDDFTFTAAAPATVQAEAYSSADGVSPFTKAGAHGGQTLGHIEAGDWARYDGLAVNGATGFSARVVSGGPGGTLQVRTGSPTGPILGSVAVPNTGDWSTFQDVSTNLSDVPAGTADVYLTFAGSGGGLFDVDDFTFTTTAAGPGPVVGLGGLCLDVQGANPADGTQVQVYTCNGTPAQTWTRSGQTLQALGKCLDVEGASTENNAKIQLYHCNASGAQNWVPQSDGTLVNPNSGKCLDVEGGLAEPGTKVLLWTCWGGDNQKWDLTP